MKKNIAAYKIENGPDKYDFARTITEFESGCFDKLCFKLREFTNFSQHGGKSDEMLVSVMIIAPHVNDLGSRRPHSWSFIGSTLNCHQDGLVFFVKGIYDSDTRTGSIEVLDQKGVITITEFMHFLSK